MATPAVAVVVPIIRGLNQTITITTHTLTGEGARLVISLPGHCVGQGGGCQEVAVEDSVRCSTITGEKKQVKLFLLLWGSWCDASTIRVMAETYAADRDRTAREKERESGATGIPFSHASSVQGNPMRAGGWSSSSRYHRHCTREEAEWSDRVPSY